MSNTEARLASIVALAAACEDLDSACLIIQDSLGVTDGGYADHHFSGEFYISGITGDANEYFQSSDGPTRCKLLQGYAESELASICDGRANVESLDFFAQVDLAITYQKRDSEIDGALLAEEYHDSWLAAFGDCVSEQGPTDALNCFLNHVCEAARIAARNEEGDSNA
jgi:hypothetical protein